MIFFTPIIVKFIICKSTLVKQILVVGEKIGKTPWHFVILRFCCIQNGFITVITQ